MRGATVDRSGARLVSDKGLSIPGRTRVLAHNPRRKHDHTRQPHQPERPLQGGFHGVIELNTPQPETVRFRGRNRADAKRKALNFWYINQNHLNLSLREFSAQCRLLDDERTIVFYADTP